MLYIIVKNNYLFYNNGKLKRFIKISGGAEEN